MIKSVIPAHRIDGWHSASDGSGVQDWKMCTYVNFAVPNVYYKDSYLNGLIYQTGPGMPGYPASPATQGAMGNPWGGPAQIMPSMPLQYMYLDD